MKIDIAWGLLTAALVIGGAIAFFVVLAMVLRTPESSRERAGFWSLPNVSHERQTAKLIVGAAILVAAILVYAIISAD